MQDNVEGCHNRVTLDYEQSLRGQSNIDLQAGSKVRTYDARSCHDDQMCLIILKSHLAGHGPETSLCH